MGAVNSAGAGRVPVDVARQAAVLAKQKQVAEEQGEQAVKLIESARVQQPRSTGVGQILDIRV
jgi:hypothetical protein